jgi:hypothetical protein
MRDAWPTLEASERISARVHAMTDAELAEAVHAGWFVALAEPVKRRLIEGGLLGEADVPTWKPDA